MSSELWTLAGQISYRGKLKGTRGDLESDAESMLMDICLYAAGKYPGFTFDAHPVIASQKLAERFKL
jgi:hypothetical protein